MSETIADGSSRIEHILDLNEYGLNDLPREIRTQAKTEVADYLKNEILRRVSSGRSPVQGEGRFRILDSDYAENQKGGVRTANLELEGDLLNDFDVLPTRGSNLRIGHTGSQTPKADGHNQLSTKAKNWASQNEFPKRRYIPDDNQKFTRSIERGIRDIISDFRVNAPAEEITFREEIVEGEVIADEVPTSRVTVNELFSDDIINALLADALRRRG